MGSRGKGKREFRLHGPGNVGGSLVPRVLELLGQRFGRRETNYVFIGTINHGFSTNHNTFLNAR